MAKSDAPTLVRRPDADLFESELASRQVDYLYHATYSVALSAIHHTGGLWSHRGMTKPPFRLPDPGRKLDGLPSVYEDHICLSLLPYGEFIKRQVKYTKDSVCLILIDPSIITFQGVAFSPMIIGEEDAARNELTSTSIGDFRNMFQGPSSYPFHSSAKILVPGHVPLRFFRRTVFATEPERKRAVEIVPVDIGDTFIDPTLFPRATINPKAKPEWPVSADEVERFWMETLGLV
jgi:hypothetical protein